MKEIALNLLDLAENSLRAGAKRVAINLGERDGFVFLTIEDDGCGMDEDFLSRVTDPYTTTRSTRNVGLGLPLAKMEAEMSGGSFSVQSRKNVGTKVSVTFQTDHIDRPPLGNVGESVSALLADLNGTRLIFTYEAFGQSFVVDTQEILRQLDGIPIDSPEILVFVRELIQENIKTINGGILL